MIDLQTPNCVGCGVCSAICPTRCISIIENEIGEYRPFISNCEECINCGLCERHCIANENGGIGNVTIKAMYGYAHDEKERYSSSSGGIFFEIAKSVIAKSGLVVGVVYNDLGLFEHMIADNIDSLKKMRGSKYCESKMDGILLKIKELLDLNIVILFSGVPCQIAALKVFLEKEYKNLITCEVFCHGAPRVGVFRKYRGVIEKKHGKIRSFNFRSKKYGWQDPSYEIITKNKVIIQRHKYNAYHLMFGSHHSLRESCFQCQFRKRERQADISLGDFWGIEKFYPAIDTQNGVSAILINTEKGNDLLKDKNLDLKLCKIEEIFERNRIQIEKFPKPHGYERYNDDYQKYEDTIFFSHYKFKYLFGEKILKILKRILC